MADPITLSLDPASLRVKPGDRATTTLTVRNRTEEVEAYRLRCEGVPEGWVEFSPDQVSAFPLQSVSAQVIVHPPAEARGATYHLVVIAASQENSGVEGRTQLDVDVPVPATVTTPQPQPTTPVGPRPETLGGPEPTPKVQAPPPQTASQIQVRAEPVTDSKLPPPARQWKLVLKNAGSVLDSFSFSIRGVRPEWVNVEPPEITLNPGEEGSSLLTVTPSPETAAGATAFTLRTFSHLNLSQRTEIPLQVVVAPRAAFRLAIYPRDAETQGQRDFQVNLLSDANSNTDLQIALAASDQDNACDYTFEPVQVFLPARQSLTSTLHVRPRVTLQPNERKTYTFTVTATPAGNLVAPLTDSARLTHLAPRPITLTLRPQVQTTDLEAEYTLVAVNPSAVPAVLHLSAADPELACTYDFQPARVVIPPASETQARLHVKANNFWDGEGQKTYEFTVQATRENEMTPTATATGRMQQRQIRPVTLQLVPPQLSSTGGARFFLQARNPRATPVRMWLEALDETDALSFNVQPNLIALSPGAEGRAALFARPKDRLMPGEQRRVHKFTVNARIEGPDKPISVSGVLAQTPGADWSGTFGTLAKLAIWVAQWVLVFFALLVLATLFFEVMYEFACRRPSPELTRLVQPIYQNAIGQFFVHMPYAGLVRAVVQFVGDFAGALFGLKRACPF